MARACNCCSFFSNTKQCNQNCRAKDVAEFPQYQNSIPISLTDLLPKVTLGGFSILDLSLQILGTTVYHFICSWIYFGSFNHNKEDIRIWIRTTQPPDCNNPTFNYGLFSTTSQETCIQGIHKRNNFISPLLCSVLKDQNQTTLYIHQYPIKCFLVSDPYTQHFSDVSSVLQSIIIQNIVLQPPHSMDPFFSNEKITLLHCNNFW